MALSSLSIIRMWSPFLIVKNPTKERSPARMNPVTASGSRRLNSTPTGVVEIELGASRSIAERSRSGSFPDDIYKSEWNRNNLMEELST